MGLKRQRKDTQAQLRGDLALLRVVLDLLSLPRTMEDKVYSWAFMGMSCILALLRTASEKANELRVLGSQEHPGIFLFWLLPESESVLPTSCHTHLSLHHFGGCGPQVRYVVGVL